MDQTTQTSTRAIVSLVLGIVALPAIACFGCGGIILGLAALLVGLSARKQIADSDGMQTGQGLATAGIVLGIIGMVVGLIYGAVVIISGMTILGPGMQEMFEEVLGAIEAG